MVESRITRKREKKNVSKLKEENYYYSAMICYKSVTNCVYVGDRNKLSNISILKKTRLKQKKWKTKSLFDFSSIIGFRVHIPA